MVQQQFSGFSLACWCSVAHTDDTPNPSQMLFLWKTIIPLPTRTHLWCYNRGSWSQTVGAIWNTWILCIWLPWNAATVLSMAAIWLGEAQQGRLLSKIWIFTSWQWWEEGVWAWWLFVAQQAEGLSAGIQCQGDAVVMLLDVGWNVILLLSIRRVGI